MQMQNMQPTQPTYPPPKPVYYKNPGLAAVLSFFWTGLGQIYNGQIAKGIFFIIAWGISWLMMLILIGFITTPLIWLYGMYDAYKSAEKINIWTAQQYGPGSGPGYS